MADPFWISLFLMKNEERKKRIIRKLHNSIVYLGMANQLIVCVGGKYLRH